MSFVHELSADKAFRERAAEELDAKCQMIEAETELDQNTYFREVQEELSE